MNASLISRWLLLTPTHKSLVSKFNVLRFNDDNEVYLRLRDLQSNEELYTMQLKDFMKDNNITVNGINEATVGIRIRFNGTRHHSKNPLGRGSDQTGEYNPPNVYEAKIKITGSVCSCLP